MRTLLYLEDQRIGAGYHKVSRRRTPESYVNVRGLPDERKYATTAAVDRQHTFSAERPTAAKGGEDDGIAVAKRKQSDSERLIAIQQAKLAKLKAKRKRAPALMASRFVALTLLVLEASRISAVPKPDPEEEQEKRKRFAQAAAELRRKVEKRDPSLKTQTRLVREPLQLKVKPKKLVHLKRQPLTINVKPKKKGLTIRIQDRKKSSEQ